MDTSLQNSYSKIAKVTVKKYYDEENYEESEEGRNWLENMKSAREKLRREFKKKESKIEETKIEETKIKDG